MNVITQLSPEAQYLHRHLTEPGIGYPDPWPDASRLTAADLGHLLPLAYRTRGTGPAFSMRYAVENEVKQRQPQRVRREVQREVHVSGGVQVEGD
ncbi:hypothetical protein, partial [Nonomuraea rubra]|uniref:hypothetical protein n=1 Tax=Nonomuraea rubra TaxID=46180 RepID=UPI003611F91B